MNIDAKEIKKMALRLEMVDNKLEYLAKQLDKNRIKYPLGITYDQLASYVAMGNSNEIEKKIEITHLSSD